MIRSNGATMILCIDLGETTLLMLLFHKLFALLPSLFLNSKQYTNIYATLLYWGFLSSFEFEICPFQDVNLVYFSCSTCDKLKHQFYKPRNVPLIKAS